MAESATLTLTGTLAPRDRWQATRCPIGRTMETVSNRSAFLILREAFYGTTRFDDFATRVGISEPVTATRLKDLVEAGLLERRPYRVAGARTRHEYLLTEKGAEFFPVLAAMMQWGEKWLGPSGLGFEHHDCGATVHTELRCTDGHSLEPGDIDVVVAKRRRA